MRAQVRRVGEGRHPVILIDDAVPAPERIVDLAAAMAPFPPARNNYPGVRRILAPEDAEGGAYVADVLARIAPLLGKVHGAARFRCVEASFSMVTMEAGRLAPLQRMPHFDSVDPGHIAVLHYLSDCAGTAFYRHRASGAELATAAVLPALTRPPEEEGGYIVASTAAYEQTGVIEGRFNRIAVYQGAMLHSGLIDPAQSLDADPRTGRLTGNLFLQLEG
jgi:hypothetical protein